MMKMEKEAMKMEEKEKKIRKEVKKIRSNVTLIWIFVIIVLILLTPNLILSLSYLLPSLKNVLLFYFIGIIFGFIGLIVRSISMLDYIDHKMMIDKLTNYDIKYRWYEVSEQRKIIYWAYFFKYPILITPTIVAFISLAILTPLDIFSNQLISIILIGGISMVVGFILKLPKGLS